MLLLKTHSIKPLRCSRRLHGHRRGLCDALGRQPPEDEEHRHCKLGRDAQYHVGHLADPVEVWALVEGQQQKLHGAKEQEEAKSCPERLAASGTMAPLLV